MKTKGLILGAIQLVLALSVAAQFYFDRATLPRAWVKSAPYDPHLPIRGRYVRMRIQVEGDCQSPVELYVESGQLRARRAERGRPVMAQGGACLLVEPVAFFIPPNIPDPSRVNPGEELWVEASVPRRGPPRPVQLGIRKDGELRPLDIR